MHDVGHLAHTRLVTHLAANQRGGELGRLLHQALEVETDLVVQSDSVLEGEQTRAAQVEMTEQLADVLALLLTHRAREGCLHNAALNPAVDVVG